MLTSSRAQKALAALTALLPLALVVDVLVPHFFHGDVLSQLDAKQHWDEVTVVLLGILFAIAILRLGSAGHMEVLARVALVGWSLGLSVLAFEAAMRVLAPVRVYPPGLRVTLHPDPAILHGTKDPAHFTVNQLGLRGREWEEGSSGLLCVGGSTTICSYLDDSETWPQRTADLLNARQSKRRYWVGNAGKSGLDSFHHLELLRRLPEAATLHTVVILCGVNDFTHSLRLSARTRAAIAPSQVFESGGALSPLGPLFKQTFLYKGMKGLLRRVRDPDQARRVALDVEDERGTVYASRRALRQQARQDLPLPPLEEPLVTYRHNLAQILSWCRQRGIRCVLMTQPTLWQDPMPPELEALTYSHIRDGRTLSAADMGRGMVAFNRALLEVCHTERAECVDLAAAIPKDAVMHYDQEHFTRAGAARVAGLLADYLLSRE